jgi:hypothetical protein
MAHYAKLDENNIVIDVIVIADHDCFDENGVECEENGRGMCEALSKYAKWKKTSYNTKGGVHYDPNTGEPSADQSKAYRWNFGQVGFTYNESLDSFIPSKPNGEQFNNWVLDTQTRKWILPNLPPTEKTEYFVCNLEQRTWTNIVTGTVINF